ncbi:MAG: hypothetical protein HKN47_16225 [Pirellulaceae bacterium]|nr:hypothetical protein [Pirellulaceae bacterium]
MNKRFAVLTCLLLLCKPTVFAQSKNSLPPKVDIDVKTGFRPAYTATPIVNRIEARRGQRIPFSFDITSHRDDVTALVRPVALRQDINGAFMADVDAPAPTAVKLLGKKQLKLEKDNPITVSGEILVPNNQSPFHSFGILIRDQGKPPQRGPRDETRFGFNFVTQYILRCDVTVSNGRNDDIRKLEVTAAEFVQSRGVPVAIVTVTNPTASTIEFELQSRLLSDDWGQTKRYVGLTVPARSGLNAPERYVTRILPGATIQMEAHWPQAVFAGRYTLETRTTLKRRVYQTSVTQLQIGEDQFPAQETWVRQIAPSVHASPSQIAVGHDKPYRRMQAVTLMNHSKNDVLIELSLVNDQADDLAWAVVRPTQLSISPGGKRVVMVSLNRIDDRKRHRVGSLRLSTKVQSDQTVTDQTADQNPHSASLPIAFFGSDDTTPQLELAPMAATKALTESGEPSINLILPVTNQSTFPVPLSAVLSLRDVANNQVEIQAGFGKWLLPSETRDLVFHLGKASNLLSTIQGSVELLNTAQQTIYRQRFAMERKQPVSTQRVELGQ